MTGAATRARQPRMWADPPVTPGFEAFWQAYPAARRVNKQRCVLLWAARELEPEADAIVQWVRDMTTCDQWRRGIVPLAYTTLHQARWLAGLPPDVTGPRAEYARSQQQLQAQQQHPRAVGEVLEAAVQRLRAQRQRLADEPTTTQPNGVPRCPP